MKTLILFVSCVVLAGCASTEVDTDNLTAKEDSKNFLINYKAALSDPQRQERVARGARIAAKAVCKVYGSIVCKVPVDKVIPVLRNRWLAGWADGATSEQHTDEMRAYEAIIGAQEGAGLEEICRLDPLACGG